MSSGLFGHVWPQWWVCLLWQAPCLYFCQKHLWQSYDKTVGTLIRFDPSGPVWWEPAAIFSVYLTKRISFFSQSLTEGLVFSCNLQVVFGVTGDQRMSASWHLCLALRSDRPPVFIAPSASREPCQAASASLWCTEARQTGAKPRQDASGRCTSATRQTPRLSSSLVKARACRDRNRLPASSLRVH